MKEARYFNYIYSSTSISAHSEIFSQYSSEEKSGNQVSFRSMGYQSMRHKTGKLPICKVERKKSLLLEYADL